MLSKNLYLKIILRVLLLVLVCASVVYFILNDIKGVAVLLGVVLILQIISLVNFLNSTNRKLMFFFNAIENSDSTISFSENTNNSVTNQLNAHLNRVNRIIQDEKLNTQAQEQYYQTLLAYTNVGLLSINAKGHILFANESAKKLLNCDVLTHIQQLKKIDNSVYNLVSKLQPFKQQVISITNERATVELKIESKPIEVNNVSLLLVSIQNIYSELDTKQVDSWMGLIKVMSHEIMNALAPITSISDSLSKVIKTDNGKIQLDQLKESDLEKVKKGLAVIQEQSLGLTDFVTGYRSLTKIPKPDKTLIKVPALFEKIITLVSNEKAHKNISLETQITPTNLELFADENQIMQVLVNLIKNSIDALIHHANGVIKLQAIKTTSGNIEIQVIDNGTGISENNLKQIFIPFFTTKEKGTGIGLSLSKHIMKLHQGHLMVKSTPDVETVFTLLF
ncbi:histidine kinase [Polaribacter aquimarinus]|uniref:histidine kinase n=2 Tax=Polaribacter aquimarinus TaxID=2100726 RepID=A0A2U2JEG3_9FLAO|nr:histidine kinase [Polaribacter aquimarinus]